MSLTDFNKVLSSQIKFDPEPIYYNYYNVQVVYKCTKQVALLPGTRTQLQACMDKLKGSFSQVNIKYDSL